MNHLKCSLVNYANMTLPDGRLLFLLLIMIVSCEDPERNWEDLNQAEDTDTFKTFLLDGDGDTISAGNPIPLKMKSIDLDGFSSPEWIPVKAAPIQYKIKKNTTPVTELMPPVAQGNHKIIPINPDSIPLEKVTVTYDVKIRKPVRRKMERPKISKDAKLGIVFYDSDTGLNGEGTSVLEDSRGNLWIGTSIGLYRFDGQYLSVYTVDEGLAGDMISSIFEDRQGDLWFGTVTAGLYQYDGHQWSNYSFGSAANSNWVTAIAEDYRGDIWVGSYAGALMRFDGQNFYNYSQKYDLSPSAIHTIFEDSKKNLWIATMQRGLYKFDESNFTQYNMSSGLSDVVIMPVLETTDGALWIGTWRGGITILEGDSISYLTTKNGLSSNSITAVVQGADGRIWIGTSNAGLNLYDGSFLTYINEEQGLSNNSVSAIEFDNFGNAWIGTANGLNKIPVNTITYIDQSSGIPPTSISGITKDASSNIWFGSYNQGAGKYDGETISYYSYAQGGWSHYIRSIDQDISSKLWFASGTIDGGLVQFDGKRTRAFNRSHGLPRSFLRTVLDDQEGNLWFNSESDIFRYDGKNLTQFTPLSGADTGTLEQMVQDSKGFLWILSSGSVARFDGKEVIYFSALDGFQYNYVSAIAEDNDGHLWFGTDRGLTQAIPSSIKGRYYDFKHFELAEGTTDQQVFQVTFDKNQNAWMTTNSGIVRAVLDPVDSTGFKDIRHLTKLRKEDGLKRLDLHSVFVDSKNQIYWGTGDGLTMLDLNNFHAPKGVPTIQLTGIALNQKALDFRLFESTADERDQIDLPLNYDSLAAFYDYPINLELPYFLNHLTLHYTAIDWAGPDKVHFQYKMEGLDDDWSPMQTKAEADYRNLPYGKFTFKIRAIGAAQVWSKEFHYSFKIFPPWWLSWWAYCLYSLLILSLSYLLYRFLLRRQLALAENRNLKELDAVKTKLYTNITHEFRTPLTVIEGLTKLIQTDAIRKKDLTTEKNANIVKRNSAHLLNLVNQLLELRKLESGTSTLNLSQEDVIAYVSYILQSYESYADTKNIRLHFWANVEELNVDLDADKLLTILTNLISNSIKYTHEGGDIYVRVEADSDSSGLLENRETKKHMKISVRDTGIGISAEMLPHIFDRFYQVDNASTRKAEGTGIGLALVRELVHFMGGEIGVKSELGDGTHFELKLPISLGAPTLGSLMLPDIKEKVKGLVLTTYAWSKNSLSESSMSDTRPRILVVEDNRDVMAYLQAILQEKYALEFAYNGQEGIERAIKDLPDLIVSDVMMPEKDGFELTVALKKDQRTSHIPIVLLTAKADMRSKIEGLTHGADAYLAKPFHEEELLIRLQKLQELRKALQEKYKQANHLSSLSLTKEKPLGLDEQFLKQAYETVQENLSDEQFGSTDLQAALLVSRTQLHRKLKALTDLSATQFIRKIRLEKAKELLTSTRMSVSEIAYEVGFKSPVYFSQAFTSLFGQAPSTFRNS